VTYMLWATGRSGREPPEPSQRCPVSVRPLLVVVAVIDVGPVAFSPDRQNLQSSHDQGCMEERDDCASKKPLQSTRVRMKK
jgi:hypothetical protein